MIKAVTSALAMLAFFYTAEVSGDCYKQSGCQDPRSGTVYQENKYFVSVDEERGSCAGCVCVKNKQYTASCMEINVVNITTTSLKKSGMYRRMKDPNQEKMAASFTTDKEVELTEEEAVGMRCEPEAVPEYDPATQMLQFRFVHYMFATWETYCCSRGVRYGNVHPFCKVQFNNQCQSKLVQRDNPNRPCRFSYYMVG